MSWSHPRDTPDAAEARGSFTGKSQDLSHTQSPANQAKPGLNHMPASRKTLSREYFSLDIRILADSNAK